MIRKKIVFSFILCFFVFMTVFGVNLIMASAWTYVASDAYNMYYVDENSVDWATFSNSGVALVFVDRMISTDEIFDDVVVRKWASRIDNKSKALEACELEHYIYNANGVLVFQMDPIRNPYYSDFKEVKWHSILEKEVLMAYKILQQHGK